MCGIAGYIGKKKFSLSQRKKLFELMKNRGPDDSGYKRIINNDTSIDFFFSRLTIIDT